MNTNLPKQNNEIEEIPFVELTSLVKAELQKNPENLCTAIAEKYGVSQAPMGLLIQKVKPK